MVNSNSLDEFKEVYYKYKKGKYTFGKYGTGEQIQKAFLDGKIFVLRGSDKISIICILIMLILVVSSTLYVGLDDEYIIIVLTSHVISSSIVGISVIFIHIILKRRFIVIGPSGVYYRKIIKTGYFQWRDVTIAEGTIHTTRGGGYMRPPMTTTQITIILPNEEKIRFESGPYGNKEFVRKVKRVMFLRLFQIYSKLAKDTIEARRTQY